MYRRLPKRGFKAINKDKIAILNLSKIQSFLENNTNQETNILDLNILKEKKFINKKFQKLKVLGSGVIKKNIQISANFASRQALEKIEKAGGKINIIKK